MVLTRLLPFIAVEVFFVAKEVHMKIFVLVVFILMYIAIIAFSDYKHWITGAVAVLVVGGCLIFGVTDFQKTISSIDFNVILMLLGIMLTVGMFSESNMPNKIADGLMAKIPNGMAALVVLSVLSGLVSAFIDNVATVLMLAPIGIAISKKLKVSPVPVIISIAVSSNLQGAATLVGDTTSIMLAGFADMSFFDFFVLDGKLSIFFAVEIGALATVPVLIFIFRKSNQKICFERENVQVKSVVPTVLLLLNIVVLVISSFIPVKHELTNGIICIAFGLVAVIFNTIKFKSNPLNSIKEAVDYQTVLFLFFLFMIIGCVEEVGIIKDISKFFISIGDKNLFLLYTVIVFGSVLLSMFIDNIPYVATMLPVIAGIVSSMANPASGVEYLLYFGLLIGATLGGNLTPVGASANVVGIGILKKNGETVKTSDFLKIGVPFTLIAVLCGYAFIWLVWGV